MKTHGDCKGASLVLIMLLSKCFLYSTIPGFLQKMLLNFFFYQMVSLYDYMEGSRCITWDSLIEASYLLIMLPLLPDFLFCFPKVQSFLEFYKKRRKLKLFSIKYGSVREPMSWHMKTVEIFFTDDGPVSLLLQIWII